MKALFILVIVLVAFSCGGKKKKTKKPSSGGGFNLKDFIRNLRTVAPTTQKTSAPKTTVKPTVNSSSLTVVVKNNFNLQDINTTEQFLNELGLGNKGPQGGGHGSADVVFGFVCALQPTFVEIPDPLKIVPCIKVNRCSGCCLHEYLACKPTSSKLVTLSYPRYASSSSSSSARLSMSVRAGSSFNYEWATTKIKEHLGCMCGCRYGPSSCNERQDWDAANCQCRCHSPYTSSAMRCELLGHFKHDPKTCLCKCALKDIHCGLKKEWDDKECKCVCKKVGLPQCKRKEIPNYETCNCVNYNNNK